MRCAARTKEGRRCHSQALHNEKYCLFHSNSTAARKAKEKRDPKRILDNSELIIILQRQLKKVKRKKGVDEIQRSNEIRQLVSLICELKGERPPDNNDKPSSSSFNKKLEKWKKNRT